jgi:hypothetical protein
VGPAGRILDQALQEAGIERRTVYVTNAVKHFKWEPRGKRRLHKTPAQREVEACHQWLEGELAAVKPALHRGARGHGGQGAPRARLPHHPVPGKLVRPEGCPRSWRPSIRPTCCE